MWQPAESMDWQEEGACAQPANSDLSAKFYSRLYSEREEAKRLCIQCPVKEQCLQWALEHKQIWGVWGGKDDSEIRRTLSISLTGDETKRRTPPECPNCMAGTKDLLISVENLPNGGRWKTAKVVTCSQCGFSWRSRTSANAIDAYNADRTEKAKNINSRGKTA